MKTKNILQRVLLPGTPKQVYDILMDSKKHSVFTGDKAKIGKKVGDKFNVYGDYITGINLALQPAKLIVQSWRSSDWPESVYSIVTYKLASASGGKTLLEFIQIGVPADDFKAKSQGWKDYYWNPIKQMLTKK
jgi:activator of HSP90 ATPase